MLLEPQKDHTVQSPFITIWAKKQSPHFEPVNSIKRGMHWWKKSFRLAVVGPELIANQDLLGDPGKVRPSIRPTEVFSSGSRLVGCPSLSDYLPLLLLFLLVWKRQRGQRRRGNVNRKRVLSKNIWKWLAKAGTSLGKGSSIWHAAQRSSIQWGEEIFLSTSSDHASVLGNCIVSP